MRILHISDLHVTPPWESLNQVWDLVAGSLKDEQFDFIVVSGDLSQRAGEDEYGNLELFAREELLTRLREPSPARVIFVPGNHDVEWNDAHYSSVPIGKDVAQILKTMREEPAAAEHRHEVSESGHLCLWKINSAQYAGRLQNVQGFFNRFYGASLDGADSKKFALLEPKRDWSCHAFPELGVAFVGLNSCDRNDKFWHGARINPESLHAATRHLQGLRARNPRLLTIAVWHHGFSSQAGRPDRLALSDAGSLLNLGAQLGVHGHTHVSESHHVHLLDGRIPIVATGSLAAGRGDLPDGTPNQFCLLDVHSTRISVEVRRLDHLQRRYAIQEARRFSIAYEPEAAVGPSCKLHRRVCQVNADGIQRVKVHMTGVRASGQLPLALVTPPYCAVVLDGPVKVDNRNVVATELRLSGGKRQYEVSLNRSAKQLDWSYYVSNAVALTAEELSFLPDRKETYPHIEPDEDAYSYVARLDCEQLDLEILFESAPALGGARLLVEKRSSPESDSMWEPDDGEMDRLGLSVLHTRNANGENVVSLSVAAPIVGRRYSLVFKPGSDGRAYPRDARELGMNILEQCRGKQFEEASLRAQLTDAVDVAIADRLGAQFGEWSAHLWHGDDRALLPAFGPFASQAWSTYFEAGTGVAGHTFRHSNSVGWRDDFKGKIQTIYRASLELPGHRRPKFRWILCVPLRVALDGPSIGVIGLARTTSRTQAERNCESYISQLNQGSIHPDLRNLAAAVNVAFWTVLSKSRVLSAPQRKYAKSLLAVFRQASRPSEFPSP